MEAAGTPYPIAAFPAGGAGNLVVRCNRPTGTPKRNAEHSTLAVHRDAVAGLGHGVECWRMQAAGCRDRRGTSLICRGMPWKEPLRDPLSALTFTLPPCQ